MNDSETKALAKKAEAGDTGARSQEGSIRKFLDPQGRGDYSRRTPLKLSTPKDVACEWGLSEVAQWRARRAGVLSYYRIGGRLFYSDDHLLDYAKLRENVALRKEGQGND